MNDKQLSTICTLAECGSFNKAENLLYVSKQALLKQVNALEGEIGFQIFYRSGKGIMLTPVGEVFVQKTKAILSEMEMTVQKCRELAEKKDTIRISVPMHPKLLLEKELNSFSQRYPNIRLDICLRNGENPIDIIRQGKADIVECSPRKELDTKDYKYYAFPQMPYYGLISTTHPLAGKKNIRIEDLSGYRIGVARKERCKELLAMIEANTTGTEIVEDKGEELQFIYNFCLNQGVYISKAVFAKDLPPFISFPIKPEIAAANGIYYRKDAGYPVQAFLEIVKETYPET